MDQQKLRTLVFEKTGIRIDSTDPVFALVALNEALLEEAVQRHMGLLEQTSRNILQQLQHSANLPPAAGSARAASGQAGAAGDIWENGAVPDSVDDSVDVPQDDQGTAPVAGDASATLHPNSPSTPAPGLNPGVSPNSAPAAPATRDYGLVAITAAATALLVLLGQALFIPRAPAALSAQQEAQILQAEKLQKALPRLDAKVRAQVEAEMQK